jgi:peptidoglycan/LPS O-acetylase OafA/YrhL
MGASSKRVTARVAAHGLAFGALVAIVVTAASVVGDDPVWRSRLFLPVIVATLATGVVAVASTRTRTARSIGLALVGSHGL